MQGFSRVFENSRVHCGYRHYATDFLPPVVYDLEGARSVRPMRWGLLPVWAKSEFDMPQPFNAQAEGILGKPFFRDAIKKRRCLVPASAFFDFNSSKKRFRFSLPNLPHFAFAGIFNAWGPDELHTVTFITGEPSKWFSAFHDRQPVTLARERYEQWLDPKTAAADLLELMTPGRSWAQRARA